MIGSLHGIVSKPTLGEVLVNVGGVGYRVKVSSATWEQLQEGERTVWVSTFVREDRFDLFGFADEQTRTLFEELIERQGIGPKLGLELSAVSRSLLQQAMDDDDPAVLAAVKGVGKKTAEKLLIELKSVAEKHPSIFAAARSAGVRRAIPDADAIAALLQLGYGRSEAMDALASVPAEHTTTEARVSAALRSL